MMPNGPMKITSGPMDISLFESEYKVEDEELKVWRLSNYAVCSGAKCSYVNVLNKNLV